MKRYNIDGLPGLTMQGKKGAPGERGCMTFCNVMNVYELNSKYKYAIGIDDIDGVLGVVVFPANGIKPIVGDYVINVLQRVSNLYEIDTVFEFTKEELSSYNNEYSEEENDEESIDNASPEEILKGNIINLITHLKNFDNIIKELKDKDSYAVFHLNLLNQWLYNEGLTSKDSDISILTQTFNVERTPWKGEYTPKYLNKEISYVSSPYSYFAHIKNPGTNFVYDNPEQVNNDLKKFFEHFGNLANYYTDIFDYNIDENTGFVCDREIKKENQNFYPWVNVTENGEYPRIKTQIACNSGNGSVYFNSDERIFVGEDGVTSIDPKLIINAINDEESEIYSSYIEQFSENSTIINFGNTNNPTLFDEDENAGHHLSFLTIRLLNSLDIKEETDDEEEDDTTVEIQPYNPDEKDSSISKEKEHNPYIVRTSKIDAGTDSNYTSDEKLKAFKKNTVYKISPTSGINKKTVDVTVHLGKQYFNYNGIDTTGIDSSIYTTTYDAIDINKETSSVITNYTFNRYEIEVTDADFTQTTSFQKSDDLFKNELSKQPLTCEINNIKILSANSSYGVLSPICDKIEPTDNDDANDLYISIHIAEITNEGNYNIDNNNEITNNVFKYFKYCKFADFNDNNTIINEHSIIRCNVNELNDKSLIEIQNFNNGFYVIYLTIDLKESSEENDNFITLSKTDRVISLLDFAKYFEYDNKNNKILIDFNSLYDKKCWKNSESISSIGNIKINRSIYNNSNEEDLSEKLESLKDKIYKSIDYKNVTTCIKYKGIETDDEGKIRLPIISTIPNIKFINIENNIVSKDSEYNVFAYVEVQYHDYNKDKTNNSYYYLTYPFYKGITIFDKLFYNNNCLDCYLLPRDFYLTNKDDITELIGTTYKRDELLGLRYDEASNYYWNDYIRDLNNIEETLNTQYVEKGGEIPIGGLFRTINGFILYYDSSSPSPHDALSILKDYDFSTDSIVKNEDEKDDLEIENEEQEEIIEEDENKSILEYIDEHNNEEVEKVPYSLTQFLLKSSMPNKTLKNIKIEVELYKNDSTKVMNVSSCVDTMWDTSKYASDTCFVNKKDKTYEFPKNSLMQAMYDQYMKMSHSFSVISDKVNNKTASPSTILLRYKDYLNSSSTTVNDTITAFENILNNGNEEDNPLKYAYISDTDFDNIEISQFMIGKYSRMGWSKNYDNTLNFDNEDIFPCTLLLKDYGEEFSNGQFVSSIMLPQELTSNCSMKIYAYIKGSSLSATKVLIGETMMEETY